MRSERCCSPHGSFQKRPADQSDKARPWGEYLNATYLHLEAGIDLDKIQRYQAACLGHALGDEVTLS